MPMPLTRRALLTLIAWVAAGGVLAPFARPIAHPIPDAADPRLKEIWRCRASDCPGYEYDPMLGDPDSGIPPETAFQDLPADWCCPKCGASRAEFSRLGD